MIKIASLLVVLAVVAPVAYSKYESDEQDKSDCDLLSWFFGDYSDEDSSEENTKKPPHEISNQTKLSPAELYLLEIMKIALPGEAFISLSNQLLANRPNSNVPKMEEVEKPKDTTNQKDTLERPNSVAPVNVPNSNTPEKIKPGAVQNELNSNGNTEPKTSENVAAPEEGGD